MMSGDGGMSTSWKYERHIIISAAQRESAVLQLLVMLLLFIMRTYPEDCGS